MKKDGNQKNFIKVAASLLFLTSAAVIVTVSAGLEPEDSSRLWYQMLAAVCIAGALVCAFGEDGAKGLKKAAEACREFFQSFAEKVIQMISSIFGTRIGKGYKGASFIKDYKDTSCKIRKTSVRQKKTWKRYRDMNNRERIRYFYGKLVNKQIKKGFPFKYSLTASEVGRELIETGKISPASELLFEEYNEARYNIGADITDEDVEKIKKINKNPQV